MSDNQLMQKINELQDKLETALDVIDVLSKEVNGLKLNESRHILYNTPIPPGIGCKFAYDSKGLILKAAPLVASDIPPLEIDNIKGLRSLLDSKISSSQLNRIEEDFSRLMQKKTNNIFATGIKINYDKNGFVISHDELSVDDIPLMGIDKIQGLQDQLDMISTIIQTVKNAETDDFSVDASTGCKVSYDNKGRVTGSTALSIDDIPTDIINRINLIESRIPSFASQKVLDDIVESMTKKLDANQPITPGVYTKMRVDSKGLVVSGESLSEEDIPESIINRIDDIQKSVNGKASHDEVVKINESISSIINSLSKISDITSLQNDVDSKAPKEDVTLLTQQVLSLKNSFEEFVTKIPSDTILSQIESFTRELSNINSRISTLEIKLGLKELQK